MKKKILITGSDGFIAKNLFFKLKTNQNYEILTFRRSDTKEILSNLVKTSDVIFHLAGENRPDNQNKFLSNNVGLTREICDLLVKFKKNVPVIFTSSTQAVLNNPYGVSKKQSEELIRKYCESNKAVGFVLRLPGVFGKWAKPNYNSVVATFCNNIANNIPISIIDNDKEITLCYIDDVVEDLCSLINRDYSEGFYYIDCLPQYTINLGNLAKKLYDFNKSSKTLIPGKVGVGFDRALYSTFVSYFPKSRFLYSLKSHDDERGSFVEVLKTVDSGQFSFLKITPGSIRGKHFHHSKIESFIVLSGHAIFKFRNIITDEIYRVKVNGNENIPRVVQTIPGWAHEITNAGNSELIVLVWSNEVFDINKPDTEACSV